ncbi:MAG: hypothetical protein Q9164_006599 [Protoblastenia rupestris]
MDPTDSNPLSKSKLARQTYPDPIIISPIASKHKQTIIILHGRGSNATDFSPPLLATNLPNGQTLQTSFPHAKLIFPTASRRRAKSFNRSIINQWFDNHSPLTLLTQCFREEHQYEGLRETSSFIHNILGSEIALVGAKNVILMGLSQGCAASLIALLLWHGEPLGGVCGLCGWLPLREVMQEIASPIEKDDGNLFARSESDEEREDPAAKSVKYLSEELEMAETSTCSTSAAWKQTPVFLGHGSDDAKVPIGLGMEAVHCLKVLGAEVEWRVYEGLGHWYSGEMLGDLVMFLKARCGLDSEEGRCGDDEAVSNVRHKQRR